MLAHAHPHGTHLVPPPHAGAHRRSQTRGRRRPQGQPLPCRSRGGRHTVARWQTMLVPRAASPLHHRTVLTCRAGLDHLKWKLAADPPQKRG